LSSLSDHIMPCIANFCIVIVLYAVYDNVFPFQQEEINALSCCGNTRWRQE